MPSMTREELLALPVSFSIDLAGRALCMGRDKSRQLAAAGKFPIEVHQYGQSKICTRRDLFAFLGLDEDGHPLPEARLTVATA